MQAGYQVGNLVDSWTEGNAIDYNVDGINMNTIADSHANVAQGAASILATTFPIDSSQVAYFFMPMPFGRSPNPKWLSKADPITGNLGQPPNNVMNTYNETGILSETDGQMSALSYLLLPVPTAVIGTVQIDHWIEALDIWGNRADSTKQTLSTSSSNTTFQAVAFAFGPDSNYGIVSSVQTPAFFDWTSVQQIRYMFQPSSASILLGKTVWSIYFDGFAIVKPLVVHVTQSGATSRRAQTYVQSGILTYGDAVNYAQARLEDLMMPQTYYQIKNIGRNDIPAGNLFIAEGQKLVARSVDYTFNKTTDGWLIDVKGYLPT
jgi:hypothetical protein